MKYMKKPIVIEARQLLYDSAIQREICGWCGGKLGPDGGIYIDTLEGRMYASAGDYIIQGINGEFYPCKPDIFEKTYELITQSL